VVLECLAITLVFALTCGAVLTFMKFSGYDPKFPKQPMQPPRQRTEQWRSLLNNCTPKADP
jgi:hypothetical protein